MVQYLPYIKSLINVLSEGICLFGENRNNIDCVTEEHKIKQLPQPVDTDRSCGAPCFPHPTSYMAPRPSSFLLASPQLSMPCCLPNLGTGSTLSSCPLWFEAGGTPSLLVRGTWRSSSHDLKDAKKSCPICFLSTRVPRFLS